jgi:FKBP-type peptidyl-prolyl cis-trans isomerase
MRRLTPQRPVADGLTTTTRKELLIMRLAAASLCTALLFLSQTLLAAPDDLQIIDLTEGQGDVARDGAVAVVHYTGWLFDADAVDNKGRKFDSSVDRGQPFRFPLGAGRVIKGWDQGVAGMRVGGQRRLIVPAGLAYGDRGAGRVIPPGATLVFDVELLAVE